LNWYKYAEKVSYSTPTREDFLPETRFLKLFHILLTVVVLDGGKSVAASEAVVDFLLLLTLADISDLLNEENNDRFCLVIGGGAVSSLVEVGSDMFPSSFLLSHALGKANNFLTSFFNVLVDADLLTGAFGNGFVAGEDKSFIIGVDDFGFHNALLANSAAREVKDFDELSDLVTFTATGLKAAGCCDFFLLDELLAATLMFALE
jgi:hypothetical protein